MELKVSACHSPLVSMGLGCRGSIFSGSGCSLFGCREMSNQLPCGGGRRRWLSHSFYVTLGESCLPQAQKG